MEKQVEQKDVIEQNIGAFGRWQIYVCLTIFLVKFSIGWHQLCTVFLAPPADFNCTNSNYSKCSSDCPEHAFNRDIFDETIITQWDLVCDKDYLANLAQTIFMLGILTGNLVFGFLSDRFGRRNPLVFAVLLQIVAGISASFAPELWVFILLRFFCAMATGGTMLTSFVLVMEIVGKKYRTALGVLFQIPFNLGHATLGIFGYFLRDWHTFQIAISVPSILLLSYYWLVPESPRWLLTVGKTKESIVVMQKAAKINQLPTYSIEGIVTAHVQESSKKAKETQGGNVFDLVSTREMCIRSLCICTNWIVIGLVFFGVAQFMGQISGNIFINVTISGLVQIPGNLVCIYLMDKIGRKWTLIASYVLCTVSCLIIIAVPPKEAAWTWAITTLGCIGMMSIAVCFSIIYVYSGELYPTTIRNVGLGTASMFARFGSMVAPFISSHSSTEYWIPPLVFGLLPIIAILLTLRLPETLNYELPDTIDEAQSVGKISNTSHGISNQVFDIKQ